MSLLAKYTKIPRAHRLMTKGTCQRLRAHPPYARSWKTAQRTRAWIEVWFLKERNVVAKKIYRLKEDQAFWLSLELGRREKVARHPSADFLPSPHMFMTNNDAP